ncbi:conserved hypothetical protein [Verticillium alfalfae VaMs.102]|uniref:Beta-catenin-like protein 1 N-terminal domain-containing protein n=1 Tax=Verticillium alfalfae (strain VaMs.102 / ATCC MYA-4576 / FGSC 10136) TaxID=526221 RepID=C9SGY9_VERA1|nr:conserved hypothetical protein [Verticillium alfalfae VaMs.102]EEY18209.1 conserved hypothetical protein [Verticillium alfalfae VaMs.102]
MSLTYITAEVYKSARLNDNDLRRNEARNDVFGTGRTGHISDPTPKTESGLDDDHNPLAPSLTHNDGISVEEDDDGEGRFFGGGVSRQETEIMDYVAARADDIPMPEKIDNTWLRKTALSFEKHINKNAEMRAKFENDPQKFIASEADLDTAIKDLSILSDYPGLWPELVRLGCVGSLVGLLAHDNTDIAIDAVEIIGELTDEDVAATDDHWNTLVDSMLEADLVDLLVSNLTRLNENDEADRSGVYHALSVVENILSRRSIAERVGQNDLLVNWLLARIQLKDAIVSQNKQYCAEILAIIAQTSSQTRAKLTSLGTVDAALQLVAVYRKRDPERGSEAEYMQNLFETLTCLVDEPEGKTKLLEAEGIELCLIMLREGKTSKMPALRLLDHSTAEAAGGETCQRLVEAGGLKIIFTMFMKRQDGPTVEHLVNIFASLLRLLPLNSAERIRTLAKFVEKRYEKTERLVTVRRDLASRLKVVEQRIQAERDKLAEDAGSEAADVWLSWRLEGGLFGLQAVDIVLAWLVAEDSGARATIERLFADQGENLDVLRKSLQGQLDDLDDEVDRISDKKDMLGALLHFV